MKHFAGLIAYASLVYGHGYVTNATIGGEGYEFYQPYTDPYTSPTPERVSRPIQGNGPVTDVTIADIQCGGYSDGGIVGSSPANLTADVTAGSTVDLYWTLWPDSHVGPTLTYMARCANDDCTTFMPESDKVWFKVQQDGRDGTSDTWGATALMKAGGSVSYTIPECLEPGAYLVRHEIIALHAAYSEGGAQFYPGCHQVKVTGSGSTSPSDLVAFPGAYTADDAGIMYDAYKATTYTPPGPDVFSCSGSSSSSSGSSSGTGSGSSAGVTGAPAATGSGASATSSSTLATVTKSASASNVVVAAAAATTPATDDGDDEECEAEETVTSTVAASQPEATSSGSSEDEGDDDECESEEPTDSSSTTTTAAASSDEGDDDECEGEDPTTSTSDDTTGDDEEDCDAEEEQTYAKRFTGRFARGVPL